MSDLATARLESALWETRQHLNDGSDEMMPAAVTHMLPMRRAIARLQ